ncbi:hypothetical protein CHS0354_042407 [Potamilus streckersoni]|uniref:Uncharacterized protein n=1 Tax=Potamilus streckersoni TaxID=2493646 RepID=A0AAE0SUJ5_9BIVA|nr:hypothetical protein CHS0354_042407 [Potamilus streckersoni]
MSSIKIDFKFNRTVLLYNVSKEDCTSTDIVVVEGMEIQKCALKSGTLSFTFLNISWLHKGSVFAWDEKGRLLDSVFIDVEENSETAPSSPSIENETVKWLLISALVIALVAVFLVVIGFLKYRRKRGELGLTTFFWAPVFLSSHIMLVDLYDFYPSPTSTQWLESTRQALEWIRLCGETYFYDFTIRPPAPDPAVLMKYKKKTEIEKFLHSIKNVNIKPLSRVLPATLYARREKKRAKEKTQCTGSSVELNSLELTKELSLPCSFESDNDLTMLTIDYSKRSKQKESQMRSNAKCISSPIFMYRPESSSIKDSLAKTSSLWLFD